jgi:hypothetical protein
MLTDNDFIDYVSEFHDDEMKDILTSLKEGCEEVEKIKNKIEEAEAQLSRLKKRELFLTRNELVFLMQQAGIKNFTSDDGLSLNLSTYVSGSLPKEEEDRKNAIDWLIKNDAGGLIKTVITIKMDRSFFDRAKKTFDRLKKIGIDVTLETTVHPKTLQSFVSEVISSDKQGFSKIPLELLGVDVGSFVKIKK